MEILLLIAPEHLQKGGLFTLKTARRITGMGKVLKAGMLLSFAEGQGKEHGKEHLQGYWVRTIPSFQMSSSLVSRRSE